MRWGGGVCTHIMHVVVIRPLALAFLQSRGGARRIFTDQAEIACTKREGP